LRRDPAFDVMLVPVAVYWGRAPQREQVSWFRLLLSEDWAISSGFRRALAVIFNGRNTVVEFGTPVSMRSLLTDAAAANPARRIMRSMTAQLAASRAAYIGPDLSHRRTLLTEVLRARQVRNLVRQEAREKNLPLRQVMQQARDMFDEIAADYSHNFVRFSERVLRWLLTRIYDGMQVAHFETLSPIAAGHELVYVPCHRSTMDDLLVPYAVYSRGFAVPHIAAGINLNLPLVGPMLRKGGAFFLRRSFRGSPLYTAVFMNYLGVIMARGHPIQYFIEGGRSRTGRSLSPKTGMLSMTLRSYIRQPVRPVMFVPVYLGYERIMEVDSYRGELSGKAKEKESLWGFLRSLKRLRENFGHVHVNIGEPIALLPLLDEHQPQWREKLGQDGRGATVSAAVDALALGIMRNINGAAAVMPVNLLALVLLATQRQLMLEPDLLRQLGSCLTLLHQAPYSDRVTFPQGDAAGIIEAGFKAEVLQRVGADTIGLASGHAEAMPYYRNNILHVFALPSVLACCFLSNARLSMADLQRLAWRVYPYIRSELFLRWEEADLAAVVLSNLRALRAAGLLTCDADENQWSAAPVDSAEAVQLSVLAQPALQIIERYYLAIALLLRAGPGVLSQPELEKNCQQMAQRMVTLYGFYSPEFFDRSLLEGFLGLLRRRGVIRADGEGKLVFDDALSRIADDARLVLSEQIRHSVLQVVHG
jgi:glycerol-3-phosphate O-acyltransferase